MLIALEKSFRILFIISLLFEPNQGNVIQDQVIHKINNNNQLHGLSILIGFMSDFLSK